MSVHKTHGGRGFRLGRRAFIEAALGGATVLVVGRNIALAVDRVEPDGFTADDRSWDIAQAVIEAVIGEDPEFPAPRSLPLKARFDGMLGRMSESDRDQFLQLLGVIEYGAILGYRRRFRNLTPLERGEFLLGWRDSSLKLRRQAFSALKMVSAMVYFAADETWKPIGYDGPLLERTPIAPFDPPPLSYYPEDAEKGTP